MVAGGDDVVVVNGRRGLQLGQELSHLALQNAVLHGQVVNRTFHLGRRPRGAQRSRRRRVL
jgi:hypothetical protein